MEDTLFFSANAGNTGVELWALDLTPTIAFSAATFSDSEVAGTSNAITLTRDSGDGVSEVQVNITGGTATGSGTDYSFTSPLTVTFADTETSKTIALPIINDNLVEGDETITFEVTSVSNATIGTQSTTTFTITDQTLIVTTGNNDVVNDPGTGDPSTGDPSTNQGDAVVELADPLPKIDFKAGNPGDRLKGGKDTDKLKGGKNNDVLSGGGGNDKLLGGKGNDKLNGGNGKDLLKAGKGDDLLQGGKGKDRLLGQSGNNLIVGGAGADTLVGGKGIDAFVYERLNDGKDTIKRFDVTEDVIDLADIFKQAAFAGDSDLQRFTDYVQLVEVKGSTEVRVDKDGMGDRTNTVTLAVVQKTVGLSSTNFVLS